MYYPVLRWKEGEQGALQNLSSRTRQLITPIIDFPSCDYSGNRIRDFNETAANIMPTMPFYWDLGEVSSNDSGADTHPALSLMRDANARHLSFIPIIRPNCEDDFITAIQQALDDGIISNISIRVFESDGNMPSFSDIDPILTAVGTTIEETDLILDIKEVNGRIAAQAREIAWYIGDLGNSYRRTIMIGGSMPADIYKYIAEDSTGAFSRHEWQLWNTIRQNSSTQHLEYGDYATVQVPLSDAQFSGSPRIKYTLDNSWFVARGHKQRRGENQRQILSQRICQQSGYRQSDYSFGDMRIQQCSSGTWGPGGNTQWVTIDVNQHITFVANQVSAILGRPQPLSTL